MCFQRKELEYKGGQRYVHNACIVCTAVDKKGTSQDEATSSSEEIKLIAISIVELCLAEGIS